MEIRTFWLILLKIIGISLLIKGFNVILQSLSVFTIIQPENVRGNLDWMVAGILLTLFLYLLILWVFVFKTAWLVDGLHLEKGFAGERIDLNLSPSGIIAIATIVVGGILLIESLPELCKQVFELLQARSLFGEKPTTSGIILHAAKAILGYLFVTNSKQITRWIIRKI